MLDSVAQLRHGAVHDGFGLAVALGVSEAGAFSCNFGSFLAGKFPKILGNILFFREQIRFAIFLRSSAPLSKFLLDGPADRHLLGNRERLSDFIRVSTFSRCGPPRRSAGRAIRLALISIQSRKQEPLTM